MCKVIWCNNKPNRSGRGYCRTHYDQIRKHGKILDKRTIRNPNDIIKYKDYAELVLRDRDGEEVARTAIDIDDIGLVSKYKWSLHSNGYVRCYYNRKTLFIHRIITDAREGEEIDHVNLDKLDNRKSNLRKCKHYQNCFNRKSEQRGVRKVTNRSLSKPYYSTITIQGKTIYLGHYSTKEEALKVRLEAEKKYHKDFQCLL